MSRRVLNPDQFSIVSDPDEDMHALYAYHPDFGGGTVPVGSLYWNKSDGRITNVLVDQGARRQGIATAMYNQGKTMNPPPVHTDPEHRTGLGKKWIAGVGGESV